ncbi:MAG: histidinol-phosphatase [Treponema sp.]|nr:histidinol-phosphatase [Treponema sp.]
MHTHTAFCDGHGGVEDFCRAAWDRGFVSLGFSAHAPVYRKTGIVSDWHLQEEQLSAYLEAVHAARRRWEGKLPVYLGLEVDYIPGLMGPQDADYRGLGLDYLIGSVHYVPSPWGGMMLVDSSAEEFQRDLGGVFRHDGEALMEAYWDAQLGMIRAGGFDILGHMDLIKKNNAQEQWFSSSSEGYNRRAAANAAALAHSSAVVEVNTGGLNRGSVQETYPSAAILRLLWEQGVPAIVTADAHRPEHLGGFYETARETLLRAGYTHALLFTGQPQWTPDPLLGQPGGAGGLTGAAPPRPV